MGGVTAPRHPQSCVTVSRVSIICERGAFVMPISAWFPFRVFNRSRKEKSTIDGRPECKSSGNIAFQVSGNRSAVNNATVAAFDIACNGQSNPNDAMQVGNGLSIIEVENWKRYLRDGNERAVPFNGSALNVSGYGCGVIRHDGSYQLFKWDDAAGRLVPFSV
jgi:hypothetical protein